MSDIVKIRVSYTQEEELGDILRALPPPEGRVKRWDAGEYKRAYFDVRSADLRNIYVRKKALDPV